MKPIMQITGALAIILVVLVAAGILYYQSDRRNGQDFAVTAVNAISDSWRVDELERRAHKSLLDNIAKSGPPLREYFAVLSKLGPVKKIKNCIMIHSGAADFPQFNINADYICNGQYEYGDAVVVISIVQDSLFAPWQIGSFHVDSPIFAVKPRESKEN